MDKEFLEKLGVAPEHMEAILEQSRQEQEQHEQCLAQVRFEGVLEQAIARSGGRSVKAITALLDIDALRQSADPAAAADKALAQLKHSSGYLFNVPAAVPYAPGTGTGSLEPDAPMTLAGALRQRFGK